MSSKTSFVPRSVTNLSSCKIRFISTLEMHTHFCEKQGYRLIEIQPGETGAIPHEFYNVYPAEDAPKEKIKVEYGLYNRWTHEITEAYNGRENISLPYPKKF